MTLHLLSFRPDFQKLALLAVQEHILPAGDDLGYAVHAAFVASFGDLGPKPFCLMRPGSPGGGKSGRLLAYSTRPLRDLAYQARLYADPAFLNVLGFQDAEEKIMPTEFAAGTRLGFSVRIRPIKRTGATQDGYSRAREHDIAPSMSTNDRSRAYADWLGKQFTSKGAARLESVEMESVRNTAIFLRNRSADTKGGKSITGPDAVFSGRLAVEDGEAFASLLARGIGRFRAFGFGMLLLKPAG